ncbi:hypothetical protein ABEB36_003864 [Hypothenemus hampei]|uniref:Protein FAM114A2 n=1 Tax=Hypothenemus hampei TaxID=57062 RepID=A0ABD1F429_HYPHA
METSDSEYFESADEDLESDTEDNTRSKKTSNLSVKNVEKNLENLKIEHIREPEQNIKENRMEYSDLSNTSSSEKANPDDNLLMKPKINQEPINNNSNNKEIVEQVLKDKLPEDHNLNKPAIQLNEDKSEDLWDEDELNWELEAAREFSESTLKCTVVSKNDDSDWNDFNADWESESPSSLPLQEDGTKMVQSSTQESLWENEWEPLEEPEDKSIKQNESSWGNWGWGVSSLLNTASSLTNHVSQGLTTVIESSIGIPQPEELAKINKELSKQEPTEDKQKNDNSVGAFDLSNLVSGVSKFVETTGSKVITGGLDTLEAIGKKTAAVIQEGDPGLKKKRAFLKLDSITAKPNLSQALREAKEKAEEKCYEQQLQSKRKIKNYETLFDDHQGLVHLEALEMLSKLCLIKLDNITNSLSGDSLNDLQETLEQVKELCELSEDEEEDKISIDQADEIISNCVKEISIPISYGKMFTVCREANGWLDNAKLEFVDNIDIHQQALDTLAQITAIAVEQFHKAGELLLVKDHRSTADEADSLVQITTILKSLILTEAEKFTEKLSCLKSDEVNENITNIFFEAGNSATYIQDAFQLLIPVLQVGAV